MAQVSLRWAPTEASSGREVGDVLGITIFQPFILIFLSFLLVGFCSLHGWEGGGV